MVLLVIATGPLRLAAYRMLVAGFLIHYERLMTWMRTIFSCFNKYLLFINKYLSIFAF